MDVLNGVSAAFGGAIAGLLAILLTWTKWRERHWLLQSRRRKALRKLLQESKWRGAGALDYHFAMIDAFGSSVEPRDLVHIETRQDPVRLLVDRIQAGPWVKLDATSNTYQDARKRQRFFPGPPRFSTVSLVTMFAASISGGVAAMGALYGWTENWFVGAMVCGYGVPMMFVFGVTSFKADAAQRVVSATRYPPAEPMPSCDSVHEKRARKGARRSARKAVPDAAPAQALDSAEAAGSAAALSSGS